MNNVECPVEGCNGYTTTSARPNLKNHIKAEAGDELLARHIFGEGKIPHAEFVKERTKMIKRNEFKLEFEMEVEDEA